MRKNILIVFLLICVHFANAQNIVVEYIDNTKYPTIDIILACDGNTELFKHDVNIYENQISLDFVMDTINMKSKNENKIILFLIDYYEKDSIEFFLNELHKSLNIFDLNDKINIAIVKSNNLITYLDIMSAEFSSDFKFFNDNIDYCFFDFNNFDYKTQNKSLFEAINFIISKEHHYSNKNVILLTDNSIDKSEEFENCMNLAKKNDIQIHCILFNNDSIQDTDLVNNLIIYTKGSLYLTNDYNFSSQIENIVLKENEKAGKYYKITYITSENLDYSDIEIDIKGEKIDRLIEKPDDNTGFLMKHYQHIIWIVLIIGIFTLGILFFSSRLKLKKIFQFKNFRQIEELIEKNKKLEEKLARYKSNKNFFIPEFKDFNPNLTLYSGGGEIPVLMIKNKDLSKVFEIGKPVISIGREKNNDLIIPDLAISSKHATLTNEGGEFFLIDNDSTNGTFVNDIKITKSKILVNDIIRIGNTYLKIKY